MKLFFLILALFDIAAFAGRPFQPTLLADGKTFVAWGRNWIRDGKVVAKGNFSGTSSPCVLGDGVTTVHGDWEGSVVWEQEGKLLHEVETGGVNYSSPAVLKDGRTVVMGSNSGYVYWMRDGEVLHAYPAGSTSSSPAVFSDGKTIVVGTHGGDVLWLRDGEMVRSGRTGSLINSSPTILGDGKTVVIGSKRGVHWFRDGQEVHFFESISSQDNPGVDSSAGVLSDGETIVIGANDKHVYWLKKGKVVSKFYTGASVYASPAVLSDNSVFVAGRWLKDGLLINHLPEYTTTYSGLVLPDGKSVAFQTAYFLKILRDGVEVESIKLE